MDGRQKAAVDAAQSALRAFHDGETVALPVDPVVVARDLGINVYQNRMENDLSGMIAKLAEDPTAPVDLVVNSAHAPVRQRFTVAHELGHYFDVLGQHPELDVKFLYRRDSRASCGIYGDEVFANQFAAELLMPRDAVREFKRTTDSSGLAALFHVSPQAMNFRLDNLSKQP